jgi:DNA adenine methylase
MSQAVTPLRYPGGKGSIYHLMSEFIYANDLGRGHYVEPFAGGCGLALKLLLQGDVSAIHINDVDRGVWSFWDALLNSSKDLISLIEETNITIDEWKKQKDILSSEDKYSSLEIGFATFFLNRTNRSGIIKGAGAIGGLNQDGPYKIDCRFNKKDLIKRIERINNYRDGIHLYNKDANEFIENVQEKLPKKSLFCIDPPYYNKGKSLYTSYYNPDDHEKLSIFVRDIKFPWLVTYDNVGEISDLYGEFRQFTLDIKYSLNLKRTGSELLIASDNLTIPAHLERAAAE